MEATVTGADAEAPDAAVHRFALRMLVVAGDARLAPSTHVLSDIDSIEFVRGTRDVTRDHAGGLRRLVIVLPDRELSRNHGRLLRVRGNWIVDDPRSKNGLIVAGRRTRGAPVAPGMLLQLGTTACAIEPVEATVAELDSAAVRAPPELADSYHPAFARELLAIAASDVPIVVAGATGTGKSTLARKLHAASGRPGPFVPIHGGDRGVLRGTVFIEDLDSLDEAAQAELANALRIAEATTPVRVMAATSRPLRESRLREDLRARLLGYELAVPLLVDRRLDLPLLWSGRGLAPDPGAVRALLCHAWPFNLRELDRVLTVARAVAGGPRLELVHLPPELRAAAEQGLLGVPLIGDEDASAPEASLRTKLAAKLVEHRGNISAVARDLDEHREQVRRWMVRWGFDAEAFRR